MGRSENYVKKTEEFLESFTPDMGIEVVDVEFVKEAGTYYLRAYCDMPGGIGVDECADVSRKLSDWLDKEDFISESYILEVSSPGLGRALKKDKDLDREEGKAVEGKLYKAIDGVKEFAGILKSHDKTSITIETESGDVTYNKTDISIIRLAIEL